MDKRKKITRKIRKQFELKGNKNTYHILWYIANQALEGNINLKCLHQKFGEKSIVLNAYMT